MSEEKEPVIPISELRKVRFEAAKYRKELQSLKAKLDKELIKGYHVGVDMAMEGTGSKTILTEIDPVKQATLAILNDLDDIQKQALAMWGNEADHPNVVQIRTMAKAMKSEIEGMINADNMQYM
jgi:hypothetical protein